MIIVVLLHQHHCFQPNYGYLSKNINSEKVKGHLKLDKGIIYCILKTKKKSYFFYKKKKYVLEKYITSISILAKQNMCLVVLFRDEGDSFC